MSTTPLGARTRLVLTGLLLASTVMLAACGGNDDPSADPTPSMSSTTGDPTESGSPSVAPATGDPVETKDFTVNVPEGWQVNVVSKDFVISARPPHGNDVISFQVIPENGNQPGLQALARETVRFGVWPGGKDPSIVAPTELGGEPAYHLTGSGNGALVDNRGAMHGTNAVSVNFEIYGSPTKLQSLLDSVLATWQWK